MVLVLVHRSKQAKIRHFHGQDIGDFSWQLPEELFRVVLSLLGTIAFAVIAMILSIFIILVCV